MSKPDTGDTTVQTPTHETGAGTVARFGGPAPGGTMGRFRIHGVLGAGGMGVVLLAFDPELDRKVAIKVLHLRVSGADTRAAIQREAQAMAKLSHPNVVQIYEVGRAGEHLFIAMELVEGTTLKAWLVAERRGWRDVVAMYVAAGHGLVAAHDAGLVHRDFKPENVLLGKDGRPRVTDFGLAEVGGADPTLVGGTPTYMAPEQWARGEIDARADQFAFCAALWIALFRRTPFEGESTDELKAAVIGGRRRVRDGKASERGVPGWLTAVLDRGLAVDPATRWPDLKSLLAEIDRRGRARRRAGIIAGGLAVAVASGGAAVAAMALAGGNGGGGRTLPVERPTAHFASNAAKRVTFNDACEEFPALSPDGNTVYFDGQVGADTHLFAADTATWTTRELTRTVGWDFATSISPDGRALAFLRMDEAGMSSQVADILPDGSLGPSRKIVGGSSLRPVWSPDGTRLWGGTRKAIVSIEIATGKESRRMTPPADVAPMLGLELGDGRLVMLGASANGTSHSGAVFVFPPDGGAPTPLYRSDQALEEVLVLAPEGDAVFVAQMIASEVSTELIRVPLDGGPAKPMGRGSVPARKQLAINQETGRAVWSDCRDVNNLALVQTEGGVSHLVDLPRGEWDDTFPRSVPGTTRLFFISDRTDGPSIWESDRAKTGPARRVLFGDLLPVRFAVSRDGTMLAATDGSSGLWIGPVDGSAPPRQLVPDPGELSPAFSYDGTQIYFERVDGTRTRIAAVSVAGGEVAWLVPEPGRAPASSPVDDRLAYLVQTGDGFSVRIVDVKTHRSRDVSLPGGPVPWNFVEWSPDGTRLLVVRSNARLVELEIATGKTLRTLAAGSEVIMGATYVTDEIIVARSRWLGDLWTTDLVVAR
ncbi:MAG TPA: protein kinase [Kofleriaceae bacterium]|nr:protein kinase [Kofleriaceae bacterium]